MTRNDLMIVDNGTYPKGMVDELNAVIQKMLDDADYDNLSPKQQDYISQRIMYTMQVCNKVIDKQPV